MSDGYFPLSGQPTTSEQGVREPLGQPGPEHHKDLWAGCLDALCGVHGGCTYQDVRTHNVDGEAVLKQSRDHLSRNITKHCRNSKEEFTCDISASAREVLNRLPTLLC